MVCIVDVLAALAGLEMQSWKLAANHFPAVLWYFFVAVDMLIALCMQF